MKRRRFSPQVYARVIERQHGTCACGCSEELGTDPRDIHYDHDKPLWLGGEDTEANLRALKLKHHLKKTAHEATIRAKTDRIRAQDGLRKKKPSQRDKALARMLER